MSTRKNPLRSREARDDTGWLDHKWRETALAKFAGHRPDFPGPLHWLKGWSVRLAAFVEKDQQADRLDSWVYRPDEGAADALATLGVRYPQPIGQIREYLAFVEERYREFVAMLPPEGCPKCGRDDDCEDLDPRQIDPTFRREIVGLSDVQLRAGDWIARCCHECGSATAVRVPTPAERDRIEQAGWNAGGAVGSLARIVAVAVKAIDEAESKPAAPVATSTKPKRPRRGGTGRDKVDIKIGKQLLRKQPDNPKSRVEGALRKEIPGISATELKARTGSILRNYYRDLKKAE